MDEQTQGATSTTETVQVVSVEEMQSALENVADSSAAAAGEGAKVGAAAAVAEALANDGTESDATIVQVDTAQYDAMMQALRVNATTSLVIIFTAAAILGALMWQALVKGWRK